MGNRRNKNPNSFYSLYPKVFLLSLFLTGGFFASYVLFNRYLKQFKSSKDIPSNIFKKQYIYGKVTSVGDSDNFHLFHTPLGIFNGWGWIRAVPELAKSDNIRTIKSKQIPFWKKLITSRNSAQRYSDYYMNLHVPYKGRTKLPTISVRLCGVDAPERSYFGKKAQPFSEEALNWLRHILLGKYVFVKPLSIDQYGRCVAKVEYLTWRGWKNVSLEMIKRGLGVVYEGKVGAEFDGDEQLFKYHEKIAKRLKKGLWSQSSVETPGEYKKRLRKAV